MTGQTDPSQLSREDVVFGRALIAFKVMARDAFDTLVAEYRGLRGAGQIDSLARLVLERGLMTPEQFAHLVGEIRRISPKNDPSVAQALDSLAALAPAQPARTSSGAHSTKKPASADDGPALPGGPRSASDAALRKRLKVPKEDAHFEFAGYRKLTYLGEGALGVVYRAKSAEGKVVALKAFVAAAGQGGQQELRRFLQERRVAQGLDHPGIGKVHDVGISDDIPFFCMDFIEGKTLAKLLDGPDKQPREALVAIVQKLCDAVAYLHDKGIVLRDLKPENVIVRAADQSPVIVELGLAKDMGGDLKLTVGDNLQMATTPSYTALEVQKNPASATVTSDVFSLGVLLYQATFGRLPFEARSVYDLMAAMEKQKPQPPSAMDAASPKLLDGVCLRALSPEPTKRQPRAQVLGDEIKSALEGKKPASSGTSGDSDGEGGFFSRLWAKLFGKK